MLQIEGVTMNTSTECIEERPVIDLNRGEIRRGPGKHHKLSRLESALLNCLLGKAGRPVTRGELLAAVWRLDPLRTVTRTVDMHVSMLRKKLEENSRKPALLVTVYGVGYMMHPLAQAA
jgi:DNA-binding response OmpR family regulator